MTVQDKAYFAGFFDGEGYVGLYSNTKTSEAIRVIIGQGKPDVLYELQENYGGSVYPRHDKRSGREHFAWEVRARKAEHFLKDIRPYVRIKKQQVELSLQAMNMTYTDKLLIKLKIKSINSPMGFGKLKERVVVSQSL